MLTYLENLKQARETILESSAGTGVYLGRTPPNKQSANASRWAVPCKAKKLLALAIFVEWKLPFIHNDLQALIEIAILAGLIVANVFIYYFLVRS